MLKNRLMILALGMFCSVNLNAIWVTFGIDEAIHSDTNRGIYQFVADRFEKSVEDFLSLDVSLNDNVYEIELNDNAPEEGVNQALADEECQIRVII